MLPSGGMARARIGEETAPDNAGAAGQLDDYLPLVPWSLPTPVTKS
jgi:hypothetical protein